MSGNLLETLKKSLKAESDGGDLLKIVRKILKAKAEHISWRRRQDAEDVIMDFMVDKLLAYNKSGIKYIVKTASSESEAHALLIQLFKRYINSESFSGSISRNKYKALLKKIKKHGFYKITEIGRKRIICPPNGGDGTVFKPTEEDIKHVINDWIETHGAFIPVLGSENSSQIPVIVHTKDMVKMLGFIMKKFGKCIKYDDIFAIISQLTFLDLYDAFSLLSLVEINPINTSIDFTDDIEVDDGLIDKSLNMFTDFEKRCLKIRLEGYYGSVDKKYYLEFVKSNNISISTFYKKYLPEIRRKVEELFKISDKLPIMVLEHLREEDL